MFKNENSSTKLTLFPIKKKGNIHFSRIRISRMSGVRTLTPEVLDGWMLMRCLSPFPLHFRFPAFPVLLWHDAVVIRHTFWMSKGCPQKAFAKRMWLQHQHERTATKSKIKKYVSSTTYSSLWAIVPTIAGLPRREEVHYRTSSSRCGWEIHLLL